MPKVTLPEGPRLHLEPNRLEPLLRHALDAASRDAMRLSPALTERLIYRAMADGIHADVAAAPRYRATRELFTVGLAQAREAQALTDYLWSRGAFSVAIERDDRAPVQADWAVWTWNQVIAGPLTVVLDHVGSSTKRRWQHPGSLSPGVLAAHSKWRSLIVPAAPDDAPPEHPSDDPPAPTRGRSVYRPWAELLKRTFEIDVEQCVRCGGRMRLVALVTASHSIARILSHLGEPTEPPTRAPARGPPYFPSRAVRRRRPSRASCRVATHTTDKRSDNENENATGAPTSPATHSCASGSMRSS